MVGGVISLALTVVGMVLVGIGVYVSLSDRRRSHAKLEVQGTSGELGGLAKLAEALRGYPLGLQFIFLGIACMIAGGGVGGFSAIGSS
jgi:hypothetical protein